MRERGGQATPSPPSLAARFGLDSRVSAQKAAGVPGALKVMGLGRVERLASSTAAAVAGSGKAVLVAAVRAVAVSAVACAVMAVAAAAAVLAAVAVAVTEAAAAVRSGAVTEAAAAATMEGAVAVAVTADRSPKKSFSTCRACEH